jgi:hypothetical protein
VTSNGYAWLVYKEKMFKLSPPTQQSSVVIEADWQRQIQAIRDRQEEIEEDIASYVVPYENYTTRDTGSRTFEDGGIYSGQFLGPCRDGVGKCSWENGDSYEGEWCQDQITGWGVKTWVDGSSYTGFLNFNVQEGIGLYIFDDRSKY